MRSTRRRIRALATALPLAACACRKAPVVEASPDRIEATKVVRDAAPAPPNERAPRERFALVMGHLVDLDAKATIDVLTPTKPKVEAVHGDRGYVLGGDDVLTAYDLGKPKPSAAPLWSVKPPHACARLVAGAQWVYCTADSVVTAFAASDGKPTAMPGLTKGAPLDVVETTKRTLVIAWHDVTEHDLASLANVGKHTWTAGGYPRPYMTSDGPCVSAADKDLVVHCADATGRTIRTSTFALSKPGEMSPWFWTSEHRGWVLASGGFTGPHRSVLVDPDGKEAGRIEEDSLAPAFDEHGKRAIGLVVLRGETIALVSLTGLTKWASAKRVYASDGRTVRSGDTLVVATYSRMATGCQLMAFDVNTGAHLWTADVDRVPIAHSIYSNEVSLELRDGGVVRLSGDEAGVRYEQLFDVRSGKRLFAEVRRRW